MSIVDLLRRRDRGGPTATPPAVPARPDRRWDGGWSAVPPITPVLRRVDARTGLGTRFRDGLASWQDPTFGTPLGHAVSARAPFGTVHGVVRYRSPGAPASPRGGPLLLRPAGVPTGTDTPGTPSHVAVPPPLTDREPGATPDAVSGTTAGRHSATTPPTPPPLAHPVRGTSTGLATAPPSRKVPSAGNPPPTGTAGSQPGTGAVVRARAVGRSLIVARRMATLPLRELPTTVSTVSTVAAGRLGSPMPVVDTSPAQRFPETGNTAADPPAPALVQRTTEPAHTVGVSGPPAADTAAPARSAAPLVGEPLGASPRTATAQRAATADPLATANAAAPARSAAPFVGEPLAILPRTATAQSAADAAADADPVATANAAPTVRAAAPLVGEPPAILPPTATARPAATADPAPTARSAAPLVGEPLAALPPTATARPASAAPGPPRQAPLQRAELPLAQRKPNRVTVPVRLPYRPTPRRAPVRPLLPARPLIRPVSWSTSDGAARPVTRVAWRRPDDPSRATAVRPPTRAVRPDDPATSRPDTEQGTRQGTDLIAMGPAAPHPTGPPAPRHVVTLQRQAGKPVTPPATPALPVTPAMPAPPVARPPRPPTEARPPVLGGPIPVTTVVARQPASDPVTAATAPPRADPADPADVDELARRLFEPISRLLRADLRQGRERAGRPHDRRR